MSEIKNVKVDLSDARVVREISPTVGEILADANKGVYVKPPFSFYNTIYSMLSTEEMVALCKKQDHLIPTLKGMLKRKWFTQGQMECLENAWYKLYKSFINETPIYLNNIAEKWLKALKSPYETVLLMYAFTLGTYKLDIAETVYKYRLVSTGEDYDEGGYAWEEQDYDYRLYAQMTAKRAILLRFKLSLDDKDITRIRMNTKQRKASIGYDAGNIYNASKRSGHIMRVKGEKMYSRLVRDGFARAALTRYKLDTKILKELEGPVYACLQYSNDMRIDHEKAKIQATSGGDLLEAERRWAQAKKEVPNTEQVAWSAKEYCNNKFLYFTLGFAYHDSRGRSIYDVTSQTGNPVAQKCIRHAVIAENTPTRTGQYRNKEGLNYEGEKAVAAYVMEEGDAVYNALFPNKAYNKSMSFNTKVEKGFELLEYLTKSGNGCEVDYMSSFFGNMNNKFVAHDSLYKLIALVRICREWYGRDLYWDIPVEIDAKASVAHHFGILWNHHTILEEVNLIGTADQLLKDYWNVVNVTRSYVKWIVTPLVYGSFANFINLLKKHGINAEKDAVILKELGFLIDELRPADPEIGKPEGKYYLPFTVCRQIIACCQPKIEKPVQYLVGDNLISSEKDRGMELKVGSESWIAPCTRYDRKNEDSITFAAFATNGLGSAYECKYIPHYFSDKYDPKRWATYFVTALIHNLDSQVANYVANKVVDKGFGLTTIHDAFLLHPNAVLTAKEAYLDKLYEFYKDRNNIRFNYFESIHIPTALINSPTKLFMKNVSGRELDKSEFCIETCLR